MKVYWFRRIIVNHKSSLKRVMTETRNTSVVKGRKVLQERGVKTGLGKIG